MDALELTRRLFAEPDLDLDARDRARARLEHLAKEPPRPRVWRRAGLIAAAMSGILVLQVILPPGGSGPALSAAAELMRLATVAVHRPPEPAGPVAYGRYREYVLVEGEDLQGGARFVAFVSQNVEYWRDPNGGGRWIKTVRRIDYPSERDRLEWQQRDGPPQVPRPGESVTDDFGPEEAGFEDLSSLPRDPAELLATIRTELTGDPPNDDHEALVQITSFLGRGDADPALRSALFEAAALLPGIELLGEVRDPLDRPGEGLALETASERTVLTVDPVSALPLAYESVTTEGPAEGTLSWRAYLAFGQVQMIGDVPEANG